MKLNKERILEKNRLLKIGKKKQTPINFWDNEINWINNIKMKKKCEEILEIQNKQVGQLITKGKKISINLK